MLSNLKKKQIKLCLAIIVVLKGSFLAPIFKNCFKKIKKNVFKKIRFKYDIFEQIPVK